MKTLKIKHSILAITIMMLALGCQEKFLETKPQGALSQATLSTAAGAEGALIGVYAMLDGFNDGTNNWPATPTNWIMGSVGAGDSYKGSELGDIGEITELEMYQWSAGNSLLNQKWIPLHEGIVRANNTLRLLKAATDAKDVAARIEGEARFLRAYYHFELYKVFGNVPYFTEADADEKTGTYKKKSNEGVDPLGDAIADLVAAIPLIPVTQADRGRVDRKAAQAFLGKLYMYKLDFAKAKAQLDPVVTSTSLAPCLRDLFTYATENHEESLLAVQASVSDAANANNSNWLEQLNFPVGGGSGFGCCGFHQPSQNLVNAYKVDAVTGLPLLDTWNDTDLNPATDFVDPRLDFTVGRDDVPYFDWAIHNPGFIRSRSYAGPYSAKKFTPYDAEPSVSGGWNGDANNGVNIPIIRLADAILLLAEAEIELNNLTRAMELVNMVRARADNCAQGKLLIPDGPDEGTDPDKLQGSAVITNNINDPAITWAKYKVGQYVSFPNKDYARKAVRFERRLELALEGSRFADIQRWDDMTPGFAAAYLNKYTSEEKQVRSYYEAAVPFEKKHRWFPIPTIQVELSKVNGVPMLKQNPGW